MQSEPPADFKGRQRWYAQQQRLAAKLYPPKQKKPKGKRGRKRNRCQQPPACHSFFPHTAGARKYALKHRGLTPAEWEVWSRLRLDDRDTWHKQVPCGPFILDFYCPRTRTVVEIDGPEHYTPEGLKKDSRRTGFLRHEHGLRVLRYPNDDAYLDGDILVAQIINDNRSEVTKPVNCIPQ